eukprot:6174396-Pleurochrysis_carterae.AAC.2
MFGSTHRPHVALLLLAVCALSSYSPDLRCAGRALSLVELSFKKWEEGTPLLDDFKAGIVVTERRWYEQMRHTFPYSQWTVFDPHKTYSQREFIANRNSGSGVDPSYRKGNTRKASAVRSACFQGSAGAMRFDRACGQTMLTVQGGERCVRMPLHRGVDFSLR